MTAISPSFLKSKGWLVQKSSDKHSASMARLSFFFVLIAEVILSVAMTSRITAKTLPKKLIVGYANWNQCDDKLIDAVVDG